MSSARVLVVSMVFLAFAGCGTRGPSSLPSSSPSAADLPPVWVQNEAMWQSLAAGDPHPQACEWLLTRPARAAGLVGSATSYLHIFNSIDEVYVVVLHGDFGPQQAQVNGPTTAASSLYLVMTQSHAYLAHGFTNASIDLAPLGRVHTYIPQLPVHAGVWGHTMFVGGPAPGGPWPLARVDVLVWKGSHVPASGQPLTHVLSDADGFFMLDLSPGVYVLKLNATNHGWARADVVIVKAGEPVAAGVYGEGM